MPATERSSATDSLHILVCCSHWELIGGSERYALALAPALRARGHRITVLHTHGAARASDDFTFVRTAGVIAPGSAALTADVAYILTPTDAQLVGQLQAAMPVVRFVQDHTLFCPGLNKMLESGATCERPMGRACFESYFLAGGCNGFKRAQHGARFWKPITRYTAKARELRASRKLAALVVASDYMRAELLQVGVAPDKLHVLPYFTDAGTGRASAPRLAGATAAFLARDERPLVLTAARLTLPDKGVDYLLTALAQLDVPFKALIAGSGPAQDWLVAKARAEGLADKVHFSGWLGPAELESLYPHARVVAFPSVWNEPFGLVGIEAMAHGLPVVAFDGGGVRTWLEPDVTGLLVPRHDTDAFAGALHRLLSDEAHARELGQHATQRVEQRFRADTHMDTLEALLRSACTTLNAGSAHD